jgi:hypothetical protein
MQPQPDPSSAQPATDAPQAPTERSEPAEGTTPTPPPWWRRMFRGRPGTDDAGSDAGQEAPANGTSSALTLTQEELDRKIQAETDRREARRNAQALAERKRKLRDEDPWAYAEEDRKSEQAVQSNQQVETLFQTIGSEHDRHTLDPLMQTLPQTEQQRILALEGAGRGLEGRKLIVTEALKSLEKHWKAEGAKDAEQRLRRNPAFRKQVLAEFRPGTPEPEFMPGGSGSDDNSQSVSNLLREQLRSRASGL